MGTNRFISCESFVKISTPLKLCEMADTIDMENSCHRCRRRATEANYFGRANDPFVIIST